MIHNCCIFLKYFIFVFIVIMISCNDVYAMVNNNGAEAKLVNKQRLNVESDNSLIDQLQKRNQWVDVVDGIGSSINKKHGLVAAELKEKASQYGDKNIILLVPKEKISKKLVSFLNKNNIELYENMIQEESPWFYFNRIE